jgi:hypothetical protein
VVKPIINFIKSLCFCNPRRICEYLLFASSHNTYVETISSSADTIHSNLDFWNISVLQKEYERLCVHEIRKLRLGSCDIIIDITEEDFYGKTQGLWIIPWTKEKGVEAHFKFLVCSVKKGNRKYPIAVRMIRLGSIISEEIGAVLEVCKIAGICINTVLMDRGFYAAEVLQELQNQNVEFIVFARKSELFNNMLDSAEKSVTIEHKMVFSKNKTKHKIQTNIMLVKNVLKYDWVFATNTQLTGAEIVKKYRVRWNIETDFRVQDEARIKTKSTRPNVRLFYFIIPLLIFFVWSATQKFEVSFKKFIITLSRMEIVKRKIFFE